MRKLWKKRPQKKRLVLGISGSIACYKAAELARYFLKRGYEVRVVMTDSATKFVTPLTFEALTGNPVATSFWDETKPGAIGHIELADWAQVVVVAPATADCIAKMAHGFAESTLLAVVLATKAPVVVAPAMNVNMFEHPQTKENLEALRARGIQIVEPESGELACGWQGRGRLASPYEIYAHTERALATHDLLGLRILISAGPTREAIDPVRYISNRSSGKMGVALAREAFRRGASVTLVHGPLSGPCAIPSGVRCIPVLSAQEMYTAILGDLYKRDGRSGYDVVVMAAAVADYRPAEVSSKKIKKGAPARSLELAACADIVAALGERRGSADTPMLVGFAVETGNTAQLVDEAKRKLDRKNLDFVVGNLAQDSFDKDTNRVCIVSREGTVQQVETASKSQVAGHIWDEISASLAKQGKTVQALAQ